MQTLLLIFSSLIVSPAAYETPAITQDIVVESKEEVKDSFRTELVEAIKEARKEGKINIREAIRLRLATLSPAFVERAKQLAVTQMVFSGEAPDAIPYDENGKVEVNRINWEGLGEFLKVLLPLLLELLIAFGV